MTTLSYSSPRPLDLPNARHYQSLIAEIDFSFSGRMDTYNYNTFLAESAFMLRNAIQVFQLGYFDAACYYLRESIEISTVGLYLTDLPKDDRRQYQNNWVKRDWFPAQNKAMSKLKQYSRNFADFPDKMPELFSKIDLCTKSLNKIVHKQGFDYFYRTRKHPVYEHEHGYDDLVEAFIQNLEDAICIVAVMRLGIDPFPVLLTDPECSCRYDTSLTRPYSEQMLDDCIGEDILHQYKTTEIYKGHKQWVLDTFLKKSIAAYNVTEQNYIDTESANDIVEDLALMPIGSICASLFTLVTPMVQNVYGDCGFTTYFNCRNSLIALESRSDLYHLVSQNGEDNHPWKTAMQDCTTGDNCLKSVPTFLTARSVGEERFVIETIEPLPPEAIKEIDEMASELDEFFSSVSGGSRTYNGIEKLECVKKLKEKLRA